MLERGEYTHRAVVVLEYLDFYLQGLQIFHVWVHRLVLQKRSLLDVTHSILKAR